MSLNLESNIFLVCPSWNLWLSLLSLLSFRNLSGLSSFFFFPPRAFPLVYYILFFFFFFFLFSLPSPYNPSLPTSFSWISLFTQSCNFVRHSVLRSALSPASL